MNTLPPIVQRYIDAENAHDPEALAACFAPDGTVEDDGETLVGNAAILGWARHIVTAYQLTSVVNKVLVRGETTELEVTISGTFDGSPLDFRQTFQVRDGLIAAYRTELL